MSEFDPNVYAAPFLKWSELHCWNRLRGADGRPLSFEGLPPGALVAVYPLDYRETRLPALLQVWTWLRTRVNAPVPVRSAYRPDGYNTAVHGEEKSQHRFGRALDLETPATMAWEDWYDLCAAAAKETPLRGLGAYKGLNFVHVDSRPDAVLHGWRG